MTTYYVAECSFADAPSGALREAGRVYPFRMNGPSRKLRPDERTLTCPACGARFVDCDDGWGGRSTAEECRALHVSGDEDMPSICGEREPGKGGNE